MDVILLERVEKLGQIGDVVSVKAGFARKLRHAFGASDVAQSLGEECRIVPRLLQAGFKVLRHVLICLEVFSAIPFAKFEGVHQSLFELLRTKHFGAVDRSHGLTVLNGIHIVKYPF